MADLTAIQFLRTATAGKLPTAAQLHEGALAINLADRTIYTKNAAGQIIDLGFGKGGSVNGSIDATGTVKAGKLETALADLATANITTLNVTNLNNTGLTNIANSLNIYGIFGDSNKRLTLTSVPGQTVPMNIRSEKDGSANNLVFEIGAAKLATMKLFDSPSSGYTGRFDINSYLYVDAPSQFNNTLYSRQSSVDYSIDALSPHVYSGSGDVNGLNYLLKTRAHTGSYIFHLLADGRAATLEGLALYHGDGPQHRMVTFGANYTSFANSISVGFSGVSSLGPASIALGASGTGFVLSNDAVHTMAGGASMANVSSGGVLTVLRSINTLGTGLAVNTSMIKANTDVDGNAIGDGVTHIGYKDAGGNIAHYFRGKAATNIDTHAGLIVNYDLLVKRNASISGVLNASTLTGSGSSTSYKGLTIENISAGWSYIELKALNAVAHIALKTEAADGAVANSLHLRPNGMPNGSLVIQPAGQMIHLNQYGSVSIGALNGQHAHFNTDRPQFYFYKDIVSGGNFFAEGGQKVFHQGFLPTAVQIGAVPSKGRIVYNYNSFLETGIYGVGGVGTNGPDNSMGYGSLIVATNLDVGLQILGGHNNDRLLFRGWTAYGGSWTPWCEVYHTGFKPTPNDIGAYTKAEVNSIAAGSASRPNDLGLMDLNVLYTPGIYYQGSNANTSLDRGYPVLLAGSLIVTQGAGQQQRYHVYNTNTIYTRSRYTGAWTDWVLQYNAQNKPTAADVGAISTTNGGISYGQIGGTGNSDLYTGAGIETRSSGAASPSIGFHKPGSYAGTLRMLNSTTFGFLNQDNSSYADLTVRNLTAVTQITGNGVYGSTAVGGGRLYAGYDSGIAGAISCSEWFRSSGNSGWASDTYGGGIWMQDSVWVRVYGDKKFYVSNASPDAIHTAGGVAANGSISSQSNITAVGDLSTQRNVGCTGDVYARSFYGNANIGGTGSAINCPGGIYSQGTNWLYGQIITNNNPINAGSGVITGNGSGLTGLTSGQVGLGNVPNTVHTTAANANTVVVRDGSGRVNAAGFSGNGSALTGLSWSNIVGRPADTTQWYTVHNSPGSGTQTIALPSAMVNHLVAGQMVKIRVWFNRSNSQRSERRMREMIIDGADGWAGVQWDVWIDVGWPGVSYCYVRNNVTNDVNLRNKISSQYSNITRFEYQLL
ncbi:tail fiber protein [Shewanella phage Thanatos-2]|nr:tail fiber protein [Shewanella phage Thanatos-2]